MDPVLLTALLMVATFFLFAIGCPIGFSTLIVAVIFGITLWGPSHMYLLAVTAYGSLSSQVMIAVPLFILMGNVMIHTGIARDMFDSIYYVAGRIRGSLAMGTVGMASLFSAFSGSSSAMTITIGKLAIPEMRKHGYQKELVLGTICVSGTIDFLIPPSILAIIFCSIAGLSVGRVYLAMFLPGFLLAALYIAYIGIRCYLQPHIGPAISTKDLPSWYKRLASIRTVIPPTLIVIAVIGGIYSGVVTPTESAGVGAASMIIVAVFQRTLSWSIMKKALWMTLELTSMLAWLVIGVSCFTNVYTVLGAPELIQHFVNSLPVGRMGIIVVIQVLLLVLGCLMDDLAIMMLTVPVFMPIIKSLGFNPVWFAVLFMTNMQVAWLSPPYGFSLFLVRAITADSPDITMGDIYRGVVPFICLQLICLGLVMVYPNFVLWLPNVYLGK
jgi:tripartite ATP-independent transporter DctM subunit